MNRLDKDDGGHYCSSQSDLMVTALSPRCLNSDTFAVMITWSCSIRRTCSSLLMTMMAKRRRQHCAFWLIRSLDVLTDDTLKHGRIKNIFGFWKLLWKKHLSILFHIVPYPSSSSTLKFTLLGVWPLWLTSGWRHRWRCLVMSENQ